MPRGGAPATATAAKNVLLIHKFSSSNSLRWISGKSAPSGCWSRIRRLSCFRKLSRLPRIMRNAGAEVLRPSSLCRSLHNPSRQTHVETLHRKWKAFPHPRTTRLPASRAMHRRRVFQSFLRCWSPGLESVVEGRAGRSSRRLRGDGFGRSIKSGITVECSHSAMELFP
jgi:hypothetical protein